MSIYLVSFEVARLAKSLGFPQELYPLYGEDGKNHSLSYFFTNQNKHQESYYQATQTEIQSWLREIHNIEVFVVPHSIAHKQGSYYEVVVDTLTTTWSGYETYEEALEVGLFEALNKLKNE